MLPVHISIQVGEGKQHLIPLRNKCGDRTIKFWRTFTPHPFHRSVSWVPPNPVQRKQKRKKNTPYLKKGRIDSYADHSSSADKRTHLPQIHTIPSWFRTATPTFMSEFLEQTPKSNLIICPCCVASKNTFFSEGRSVWLDETARKDLAAGVGLPAFVSPFWAHPHSDATLPLHRPGLCPCCTEPVSIYRRNVAFAIKWRLIAGDESIQRILSIMKLAYLESDTIPFF